MQSASNQKDDFLYRVDPLFLLRKIKDKSFRAAHWTTSSEFKHPCLLALAAAAHPGEDIFRICFWNTLAAAEQDVQHRAQMLTFEVDPKVRTDLMAV